MGHVETQALLAHQAATGGGLGTALFAQVDVDPAGETVLEVPLALAVAQQDELAGHWGLREADAERNPGLYRPRRGPAPVSPRPRRQGP